MSTWKSASKSPDRRRVDAGPVARLDKAAVPVPPKVVNIEAASLKIDEGSGPGGDPYNQTGQHLIDAIKELPED